MSEKEDMLARADAIAAESRRREAARQRALPPREPLASREFRRLRELEREISAGRRAFLKVAESLLEVLQGRLWRGGGSSFPMWCSLRHQIPVPIARLLAGPWREGDEPVPQADAGPTVQEIAALLRQPGAALARKVAAEEEKVRARMLAWQAVACQKERAEAEAAAARAIREAARKCAAAGWLAEAAALKETLAAREQGEARAA